MNIEDLPMGFLFAMVGAGTLFTFTSWLSYNTTVFQSFLPDGILAPILGQ